jgi:alpha-glucosidase
LRYQFLLVPDLLVAPVLDNGADTVDVYFPVGDAWVDLWTGTDAGSLGDWNTMPARSASPPSSCAKARRRPTKSSQD